MKNLFKVAVITILTASVLSCTAKDLECIRIVEKKVHPCPIGDNTHLLILEHGYVEVDERTFKFYNVNDKFCK